MASTRARPAVNRPEPDLSSFAGRAPTLRRSRNLPGATLGILLIVVCSLLVAAFASSADRRTQVLVIIRPVAAGTALSASDVRATGVAAGRSVRGIGAAQAGTVIGRVAADNLVPGTLLVSAELATGPLVGKGASVVGLALKPGLLPASLAAQDFVAILATPPAGAGPGGPTAGSVLAARATVYSVGPSPEGQSTLVSVEVPGGAAPAVAEANAQGSISLVLLGS